MLDGTYSLPENLNVPISKRLSLDFTAQPDEMLHKGGGDLNYKFHFCIWNGIIVLHVSILVFGLLPVSKTPSEVYA
jgi:hypothetical protein